MSQDPLPSPGETGPLGAVCAQHPPSAATASCPRCGNFMCDACTERDQWARCPACRQQEGTLGFPFSREAWTFSGLWEHCASLFKPSWPKLCLATLIVLLSSLASQLIGSLGILLTEAMELPDALSIGIVLSLSAAGVVAQLAISLGLVRVCLDVLEGRGVALSRLFSQFGRILPLIAMTLAMGLMVLITVAVLMFVGAGIGDALGDQEGLAVGLALGMLAALVPLLPVSLLGYLAVIGLVLRPDIGPIDQLRYTWWILRGQKIAALGVAAVGGLLMIGGAMLCGLGFLPAYAFTALLLTGLYRTLGIETGAGHEGRRALRF